MRYQLKSNDPKSTVFRIIDTKPIESWDDEIATVYQTKGSKIDRLKLLVDSLNLLDHLRLEIGTKPEKKTKAELLTIIKKYI